MLSERFGTFGAVANSSIMFARVAPEVHLNRKGNRPLERGGFNQCG
jgi:hypothetical protein